MAQNEKKILITKMSYQAFIQALLSTAAFHQRFSFLTVGLVQSPWGIPRVDSKGKFFEIQVARLPENAFLTLFLTAEA